MKESEQVLEWQAQARKEGRQQGWQEGRVEGHQKVRRASIQRAIELRFRTSVPPDLADAVMQLTDLDELSRWFDASVTCDSLDAFRAAVGRSVPDEPLLFRPCLPPLR